MNKARYFSLGMDDMRQLGLSNISLQYYLHPAPADLGAAARALARQIRPAAMPAPECAVPGRVRPPRGYSAAYYTYRWSIVIADDMFTEFQKKGLRDRATAQRYRKLILAPRGDKARGRAGAGLPRPADQPRRLSREDGQGPVTGQLEFMMVRV